MKRKSEKKVKEQYKLKIELYIMSLWLLFVLIFILTINIPLYVWKSKSILDWIYVLISNWLPMLSALMFAIGIGIAKNIRRKNAGASNPPVMIERIKNENYEYLTFLTTYIMPLICIDLTKIRYVIVLIVLLFLIGYIFIKMDLYYGNPTLALMGYRLYRAEITGYSNLGEIIIISKECLSEGKAIKWIEIDKKVWLAKEVTR